MRIRHSIFNRLTLIFSVFTIACTVMVTLIIFNYSMAQFKKDFYSYNAYLLNGLTQYFERYLEDLDSFALNIRQDEGLIQTLLSNDFTYTAVADKLKLLSTQRKNFNIRKIEYHIPRHNTSFELDDLHFTRKTANYAQTGWFHQIDGSAGLKYIGSGYQEQGVFFNYTKSIIDFESKDQKALIVRLDIDRSMAGQIEAMAKLKEGEMFFIYQKGRNLIYASSPSFLIQETFAHIVSPASQFTYQGAQYLKSTAISSDGEFAVTKIVPETVFLYELQPMYTMGALVASFFIVISLLFTYTTVKNTTSNVYKLLGSIEKISDGTFDLPAYPVPDDEIGLITKKINGMATKIEELLHREYMLVRSEQKVLMKALEARVSPHFLFNSLQAISGRAYTSNNPELFAMISALAETYRYCISSKKRTTVYDEVENLRNYFAILQLRFDERLEIEFDVDDMALEETVPRLCMQIPVENSMKYALDKTNTTVKIWARAKRCNERLQIIVEDNGVGVDTDILMKLREQLENQDYLSEENVSTGLVSLYGRLKLMYGDLARMELESERNAFFRTTITIDLF